MDEKYVVFKKSELSARYEKVRGTDAWNEWMDMALDDAVVIRTQDIFAAAGLSAYAHTIRAFITVAWMTGTDLATDLDALGAIVDYFDGVAQEAEDRLGRGECKVPD